MSLELPTVSDIMRKEVYSVYEDEPVSRVIGIFREHAVPSSWSWIDAARLSGL